MRRYELSTWIVPAVETSAGGITHTSTAKPEAVHDCVVNPVTVPDVFAQLGQFWGRAPAAVYTLPVRPRVQQAAHIPASPTPTFSYQYEEEEEEDMDPIPPQYNTLDGREIFFRHSPANPPPPPSSTRSSRAPTNASSIRGEYGAESDGSVTSGFYEEEEMAVPELDLGPPMVRVPERWNWTARWVSEGSDEEH